jgi:hypothetical protein
MCSRRCNLIPTEAEAKRVLSQTWAEIAKRRWKAERLAEATRLTT